MMCAQANRGCTRPPRIFSGPCDVVDERPCDVVLTQLTGAARPLTTMEGIDELSHVFLSAVQGFSSGHCHDAARLFVFGVDEVLITVDAGHRRDGAVRPCRQEHGSPSDDAGGE